MKKHIRLFSLYMIWWVIATVIDMFFLYIFTDIFWVYYLISQIFSFCISLCFGFLFQKYITFKSTTGNSIRQLLFFFFFQCIWLCINLLILKISVDIFHIHYLLWSLLSKWIVFLWNFIMNNMYNFNQERS